MRIVVIGGTAAGPSAAAEALRTNPAAEVVLYERESHISVGACEIPYLLGNWISDWRRLEVLTPRQFEQSRGGIVRERHRVHEIRPREKRLVVEALDFGSSHEESFDRLILATGARPTPLAIEGEDAPNVFHIRTLATARRILEWLDSEPVRHVVMVGAGYVGFEVAETLRDRGLRVTVLDPTGRFLGQSIPASLGAPIAAAARAHGVTVRREVPLRLATGPDGRVRAVHTDRREIIGCDLVLVSIGLTPETRLAAAAGLRVGASGALAVDDRMQTSASGIYACGDVVEVPHVASRVPVYLPLAPPARRSARVAARNAAAVRGAGKARFAPVTRIVGAAAFGVEAAQVGLSEAEARASGFDVVFAQIRHWSRSSLYPGTRPIDVSLMVERGTGRLLGGAIVGAEGAGLRANTLVPLIREGYSARQVTEEVDLLYNPPIAPAVDPLIVACSAAARAAGQ